MLRLRPLGRLAQALGPSSMRRFLIAMLFVVATSAQARDVQLALVEQRTSAQTDYVVNLEKLSVRKIPSVHGIELPQNQKYSSQSRKLVVGSDAVADADEVLFQCSINDIDLVIVRDEYNSLNPLYWLAAASGHPVQVSRIVALTIKNGRVVSEREIIRKASSYDWVAKVFSGEP
jgi:hypothetical protein